MQKNMKEKQQVFYLNNYIKKWGGTLFSSEIYSYCKRKLEKQKDNDYLGQAATTYYHYKKRDDSEIQEAEATQVDQIYLEDDIQNAFMTNEKKDEIRGCSCRSSGWGSCRISARPTPSLFSGSAPAERTVRDRIPRASEKGSCSQDFL